MLRFGGQLDYKNGAFAANPIDHRPDESGLVLRYLKTSNVLVPLLPVFMSVASMR